MREPLCIMQCRRGWIDVSDIQHHRSSGHVQQYGCMYHQINDILWGPHNSNSQPILILVIGEFEGQQAMTSHYCYLSVARCLSTLWLLVFRMFCLMTLSIGTSRLDLTPLLKQSHLGRGVSRAPFRAKAIIILVFKHLAMPLDVFQHR